MGSVGIRRLSITQGVIEFATGSGIVAVVYDESPTPVNPLANPPILFLRGTFGRPSLLAPWTRFLESAGYTVYAPAMPGREPTDDAVLARTGIGECFAVALDAYDGIAKPAVVLGHSMGGLLAQKIAAARSPLAAVLLASVPPGVLWRRRRALPHLFRSCRESLRANRSCRRRGRCARFRSTPCPAPSKRS